MVIKSNIFRSALICTWAFTAVAFLSSCDGNKKNASSEGLRDYKVSAIQLDSTWGYRIFQDTVPVIEQKIIPGLPGNTGFNSKQEALKTGELVVKKLNKGIFPPSVSREELDSLGIQYNH
ncbi:DUF4907 domain-containing protein [Dyadobacter sp. CY345]|uniref:DUF4907 domain-containing protein n=1 Tax=Dyadobacter sp. CY345 TaxID=2909335 RepID=UPI001F3E633F|nr:DUF4907 domain-containing protein [Dyadobacter sp. CY345]MCF2447136.1 DUF4907 domain-containing protein [Dyadobacter sp. CY345]